MTYLDRIAELTDDREKADRIADDTYERYMPREGVPVMRQEIRDALTAAALAGMEAAS